MVAARWAGVHGSGNAGEPGAFVKQVGCGLYHFIHRDQFHAGVMIALPAAAGTTRYLVADYFTW